MWQTGSAMSEMRSDSDCLDRLSGPRIPLLHRLPTRKAARARPEPRTQTNNSTTRAAHRLTPTSTT
eukprot:3228705-Alexandrium_andersonii.AAC.1